MCRDEDDVPLRRSSNYIHHFANANVCSSLKEQNKHAHYFHKMFAHSSK